MSILQHVVTSSNVGYELIRELVPGEQVYLEPEDAFFKGFPEVAIEVTLQSQLKSHQKADFFEGLEHCLNGFHDIDGLFLGSGNEASYVDEPIGISQASAATTDLLLGLHHP